MTHARAMLVSTFAIATLLGAFRVDFSSAEDQPIMRTGLLKTDLAGVEGREVVVYTADLAAGAAGGNHTHQGNQIVYVLDGEYIVEPVGKKPITLKSGEIVYLPPTVVYADRNGSANRPAKVLVFIVAEKGKP
jgi:quercetin dioxygenase-like cupin family protein